MNCERLGISLVCNSSIGLDLQNIGLKQGDGSYWGGGGVTHGKILREGHCPVKEGGVLPWNHHLRMASEVTIPTSFGVVGPVCYKVVAEGE